MKKLLPALASGLFALACNNNNQTPAEPTFESFENFKGRVQHLEEVSYKVDSIGKIGEIDSCCTAITDINEKGYSTKYHTKDSKGVITEEQNYTRFENGQFKEAITTSNGKRKSSLVAQIDKNGKYIGAQSYDSTRKMDAYYTDLKQNESGVITGWNKYKPDSTLESTYSGVFNKYIFVSSTNTDSTGKVVGTYKAKVDDKGNQIEFSRIEVKKDSTTNKVTTYKYDTFDDKGNWTQRTEYENGKPIKIVKRTIAYYKDE